MIQPENVTYRVKYTTNSGLQVFGQDTDTLESAADTAVHTLAHVDEMYPGLLQSADVECWVGGVYSHRMMHSYRAAERQTA